MGSLISYECPLEYRLQGPDGQYGPKIKYESRTVNMNYFTPKSDDPVKIIFNDENDEHDVLINKAGQPIITTYGLIYHTEFAKPNDYEYDFNFVLSEKPKQNMYKWIRTIIAVLIVIVSVVLLATLLNNPSWYLLLIILVPILVLCLNVMTDISSDNHVYIDKKRNIKKLIRISINKRCSYQ